MNYIVYINIAIIIFLLIRKLIGVSFKIKEPLKNVVSGVIAIALTPLATKVIFVLIFNLILYEYHPNREFNVDSWNENIQDRHQMSEDLMESKILVDKTKNQISNKLGLPYGKTQMETDTLSTWTYNMGSRGWGLGWKFYYLDIEYENDIAKHAKIREAID